MKSLNAAMTTQKILLAHYLAQKELQYAKNITNPKRVHLFCHTLGVIPMNSYMETKLHHGMEEWDILC